MRVSDESQLLLPAMVGVSLSQKWPWSSASKRSVLYKIAVISPARTPSSRPTPTNV